MTMSKGKDALCLKFEIVEGTATAAATRTVTGITTEDTIVAAWRGAATASGITTADVTATVSITADDTISLGTSTLSGSAVCVLWLDNSA